MTNIEVHENVLSEEHWKYLHDFISNEWFSWTYQLGTSHNSETGKYDREGDTPQLVRNLFHREAISNLSLIHI